jgi:hypothetical protein
MKTFDELYNEILKNDALKKQYAEAAKSNTLTDFTKANGVDASLDDIKAFLTEKNGKPISIDELENVSGGWFDVEAFMQSCDNNNENSNSKSKC